jgi:outer membrane receptor protein involved in Fe transport
MPNTRDLHPLQLGRVLAVVLLVLCFGLAAFAQGSGDLSGVITDATGAVVPKVAVTLTNDATGISRATESTAAGVYRFTALPVTGTYTMKVEAKGFRTMSIKGVVVSVGTTITRDVALQVGTAGETVSVEAGTQLVQTSESSVSQLVDQRTWQQMPLESRNQNSFINLVAGVVPDEMAGSTRGASVNGARGGAGNYMVEGMDNNDQGQGGRGQLNGYDAGGAVTSISPEAIQEYRVITNSFNAEYGKAGGFVTDTVLKSGTNNWHGSLFEYNRVQALAANNYFSNRNDLKDSLVRNQFGGSVGGPIKKDKAFFYFSAEYERDREGSPLQGYGTTQQFVDFVKSGQFAKFMESDPNGACVQNFGAPCPAGSLAHSATTQPIFNSLLSSQPFPMATANLSNIGAGLYTEGLQYPVPVYGDVYVSDPYHLNQYRYTGKVDYKLTNSDNLSGMILWQNANSGDPYGGGGGDIGPAYLNDGVSINGGATWTHMFSPTVLNSFKVSYLRHRSDFPAPEGTLGIPQILTGWDPMSVGFGLYSGLPQYFTDNQFQYQDSMSMVRGKHSFKFGGEYRRTRNGSSFYNDTFGTFYPWGVEDMLTDLYFTDELERAGGVAPADRYGSVYYTSAAVDPTTSQSPVVYRGYRANEFAFYFQDDWRVSSKLTVNVGLRYEYFGVPHNYQPGIDSNFYFGAPVTPLTTTSTNPWMPVNNPYYAKVATGTFQQRDAEIWNKDTNNFAPRLGFAWDVFGTGKFVVRAGSGIMYDRVWNNLFENIRFNPPYFSDNQTGAYANGVPFSVIDTPGVYAVPFTDVAFYNQSGVRKPVPNPRHMDQNIVSPYYEQFHLGTEWEFAKGYVFQTEYIGTMGHKLTAYRDINTFNGRTASGLSTTRINTNIGADNYRSNDYTSNYHALQFTVRKNYSNGLQFNSSYTYSKPLDTISDAFNSREAATVTDPMNIKNDYGPADFYIKQRFVTSFSYDLPFLKNNRWLGGWGMNGIISLQSGVPFTPYTSGYDLNRNGLLTDRVTPTTAAASTYTGGNPADGYVNVDQWAPRDASNKIIYYTCPASENNGQWCNPAIGRNSLIGPGFANVDFNIIKTFKITERAKFTFQANFFNLFNRANFESPTTNVTSSSFGQSTRAYDPRRTQLALRFDF